MSQLDLADLTRGVIDGYAERAFSYGACDALAIALHDATGWPLVKVTDAHNVFIGIRPVEGADAAVRAVPNQAGIGSALHWVVRRPDGMFIDIDGAHSGEDLLDAFDGDADEGEAALGYASRSDALDEYVEAKGEPIPIELAATFVKAVLARAEARS
jgi:hypothetical protein